MKYKYLLLLLLTLPPGGIGAWGQTEDDWNGEFEPFPVQAGVLKISEVMFNPEGGGADYVELYNSFYDDFLCDSFCLVRWIGDSLGKRHALPAGVRIPGHSYITLTTDTAFVLSHFHVEHPERLILMASMPPYPNASGTVLVYTQSGTLQDRFDYNEKMHSPLLRNMENVALERNSLLGRTNDPTNWHSASAASGYGTPTAENSQGGSALALQTELSSELLSPDGDGYQDILEIHILSPIPSLSANVTVLDAHGRIVRRLMSNAILGTSDSLAWDGRDERHNPCPRGTYIILLEAYNTQGVYLRKKMAVSVVD